MQSTKARFIAIMDEADAICKDQRSSMTEKLNALEGLRFHYEQRDVLEGLALSLITASARLHFLEKRLGLDSAREAEDTSQIEGAANG